MENQVFKVGDVVQLKGDDKFKMTVIRIYSPREIQVFWLTKTGKRLADAFPPEALKKYEGKG